MNPRVLMFALLLVAITTAAAHAQSTPDRSRPTEPAWRPSDHRDDEANELEIDPSMPESMREEIAEIIREKVRRPITDSMNLPTAGEIRELLAKRSEGPALQFVSGAVSTDPLPESEVHAAINPTNHANIVVSPIRQNRTASDASAITCPVYYTRDFGKEWRLSNFVTVPPSNNARLLGGGDPVFAFDANGRLFMAWIYFYSNNRLDSTFAGIFYAVSDNGGETWSVPVSDQVLLSKNNYPPQLGFNLLPRIGDKPWLAVDRSPASPYQNRFYVAYVEFVQGQSYPQIMLRRYLPESEKFVDRSVPISTADYTFVQFASIDVDNVGAIHVTFFGNHNSGGWGVWHAVSTNGGESFSVPNLVSHVRFGLTKYNGLDNENILGIADNRLNPVPHVAIDHSNPSIPGTLYVTWTGLGIENNDGKGFDVYLSHSTDQGQSWSTPIIVNDNLDNSDQFYSTLAVNSRGTLAVSWYDKRNDANRRATTYRIALSRDGGESFEPSVAASSVPTDFGTIGNRNNGFGIGEYTQVIMSDSFAIPVWADGRSGNGNLDIYAAFIPLEGSSDVPVESSRTISLNSGLSNLSIAPNPATGSTLSIAFDNRYDEDVHIDLIAMDGRVVRSFSESAITRHQVGTALNIEGLPAGRYVLKLSGASGMCAETFTILGN